MLIDASPMSLVVYKSDYICGDCAQESHACHKGIRERCEKHDYRSARVPPIK